MISLGITHMFYLFSFVENISIYSISISGTKDWVILTILVIIIGCIFWMIRNDKYIDRF